MRWKDRMKGDVEALGEGLRFVYTLVPKCLHFFSSVQENYEAYYTGCI